MTEKDRVPIAFQRHFVELDEVELQVRSLHGDWNALVETAAIFPEPIAAVWRVIHDYLVSLERPREGSIENVMCAEYVLRAKRPPIQHPNVTDAPTQAHGFKSIGRRVNVCELCGRGPNSSIHRRPPSPHGKWNS